MTDPTHTDAEAGLTEQLECLARIERHFEKQLGEDPYGCAVIASSLYLNETRLAQARAAIAELADALREIEALPVRELQNGVDSTMRPVTYMAYSAYDIQRIARAVLAKLEAER